MPLIKCKILNKHRLCMFFFPFMQYLVEYFLIIEFYWTKLATSIWLAEKQKRTKHSLHHVFVLLWIIWWIQYNCSTSALKYVHRTLSRSPFIPTMLLAVKTRNDLLFTSGCHLIYLKQWFKTHFCQNVQARDQTHNSGLVVWCSTNWAISAGCFKLT